MVLVKQPELNDLLKDIRDSDSVYFQPPENVKIQYPCIVYKRDDIVPTWAANKVYGKVNRYLVTSISRDPNDEVPDKLADLEKCLLEQSFVADNLYHYVFSLYF